MLGLGDEEKPIKTLTPNAKLPKASTLTPVTLSKASLKPIATATPKNAITAPREYGDFSSDIPGIEGVEVEGVPEHRRDTIQSPGKTSVGRLQAQKGMVDLVNKRNDLWNKQYLAYLEQEGLEPQEFVPKRTNYTWNLNKGMSKQDAYDLYKDFQGSSNNVYYGNTGKNLTEGQRYGAWKAGYGNKDSADAIQYTEKVRKVQKALAEKEAEANKKSRKK